MERNYQEEERYKAAKKQIKEIKGFYIHLLVYLFVNIAIIAMNTNFNFKIFGNFGFETSNLYTAFFWGIGLFAHWASVFGPSLFLGKKWEEKKIMELMKKDKEQQKKWE
ncbi:MAG: hypothetical protein CVU03_03655 [Bacteroidetes bacterium HGW-Bacteroidetes-2]|jgi:hypothetical protein|nr:MAG: hypothetical protein CVU03_03655 [Bacteroidetes bacterium HGW-Bacteroidetes-2]